MRKRWLAIILMALVCAVVTFGYLTWSIYAYAGNSEAVQADVAIVLGAAA